MAEEREIKRRNRPNELVKCIRALDKHVAKAVERLAQLCDSKDEKIALEAAKAIPKIMADMKEQAEKMDLQMLLVQHKIGNGLRREDPEDETPLVDFNEIQSVE